MFYVPATVFTAIATLIGLPLICSMAGIVGSMYVWDVPWYLYQVKQHKVRAARKSVMKKLFLLHESK